MDIGLNLGFSRISRLSVVEVARLGVKEDEMKWIPRLMRRAITGEESAGLAAVEEFVLYFQTVPFAFNV